MKPTGIKLSKLLKGSGVKVPKSGPDPRVTRIVIDSRRATPGSLFFALPGLRRDGNSYADEAVQRGAVAVVTTAKKRIGKSKCAFVYSERPRLVLSQAARRFHDYPDKAVKLVGVTGTNGKTTVAYLVRHLLSVGGAKAGCIGTIGYDLGERALPSFRTTPEAHDLHDLLAQIRDFGATRAVMEVSSHGIDQLRVAETEFDVGVFLNLSRDHLDYHRDMDTYYQVKRRLFNGEVCPPPRACVVNSDDEYGQRLLADLGEREEVATFAIDGPATLKASKLVLEPRRTLFELEWSGQRHEVVSPLIGRYNVSNLLAAIAACVASGIDLKACLERLATFEKIPGRMERVDRGQPFSVVVDYAHTADALKHSLGLLREITPGQLSVVFGCGGDRDRGKRKPMTQIALGLADQCFATADNPRSEAIEQIFDDMREAVGPKDALAFVEDRRRAIELALKQAKPGDCVLIAGKGHEPFQEFGETVVSFDDRKVAADLLELMKMGGRV